MGMGILFGLPRWEVPIVLCNQVPNFINVDEDDLFMTLKNMRYIGRKIGQLARQQRGNVLIAFDCLG